MAKKKSTEKVDKKVTSKQKNIKKDKTNFYKENFKKLLIIPAILFIFAIFMMVHTSNIDGTPIYRDVSLKGGLSAIIETDKIVESEQIKIDLETNFPQSTFTISELSENNKNVGYIIDTDLEEQQLRDFLTSQYQMNLVDGETYTSNYISPTLSNAFFVQALYILLVSFVLMSLVVFMYFRELVPSGAVVLSAIFDVTVTIGVLDLLGTRISVAGVGALLMLIGYSIDTDVLLTNRLVKERGKDYFEKAFFAFKTGTVMSLTTLIAGVAALIMSNSEVIQEIALILIVGLLVDYISTWLQNTGILLWWIEKKEGKLQ